MVDLQLPAGVTLTTGAGTYVEPRPEPRRLPFPTVAIFDRMPAAEYHADPCAEPSLSASIAGILDRQSPAHAWQTHPRLGGRPRAPSEAMDRGSLIHALLLDEDDDAIAVVHADDWRSKGARAERMAARLTGRIPVLESEHESARQAAAIIRDQLVEHGWDLAREGSRSEVSVFWAEQTASGPIQCRGRIDHMAGPYLLDIKTSVSAHPDAIRRRIVSSGYDIQAAAYVRAVAAVRPEWQGRVTFELAFVEPEPPYAMTIVDLDPAFHSLGERKWLRAVETWRRCIVSRSWPSYADDGPIVMSPPPWALSQDLEREIDQ
jgi:hypothetical protein